MSEENKPAPVKRGDIVYRINKGKRPHVSYVIVTESSFDKICKQINKTVFTSYEAAEKHLKEDKKKCKEL